jgi:hypothetical protein
MEIKADGLVPRQAAPLAPQSVQYQNLLAAISETYVKGQVKAAQSVNVHLLHTCWRIGCHIVEFEQGGNIKAEYGKSLLANLSKDLTLIHGRGFSRSNLIYMRVLYAKYPISQKLSDQLSWSHYVELLKIDDDLPNREELRRLIEDDFLKAEGPEDPAEE